MKLIKHPALSNLLFINQLSWVLRLLIWPKYGMCLFCIYVINFHFQLSLTPYFIFFFISSIRPSRLHNLRASLLHCNLVFITQIPKPYSSVQYTRHLTILFSKVLFLFLDELTDIEEFAGIYINKENAITWRLGGFTLAFRIPGLRITTENKIITQQGRQFQDPMDGN